MSTGTERGDAAARVVELQIADDPAAWTTAGFAVHGDATTVGTVRLRLVGRTEGRRGIVGWTLAGVAVPDGHLDGLPTAIGDTDTDTDQEPVPTTEPGAGHPNGVIGLDHIVVLTPDLDRTLAALGDAGLELRRIRDTTSYGSPMRQAFFRLGPTVLEVVSGDTGSGVPAAEVPATWFGLAVDVIDLDQTRQLLGEGLGDTKDAVQAGRRIATLRHKQLGLSVAVAAMDDHAGR